ncbi:hypothetical protein RRG08_031895 [Elysia crispata]|uniref:Uncharacterized protein n=1 Tax=Elysia crispata TaxID=231223 RepID=A0AAE1DYI1_9GAST|nr:hypothetical protein RRG08_031895 [Elysia crispata]
MGFNTSLRSCGVTPHLAHVCIDIGALSGVTVKLCDMNHDEPDLLNFVDITIPQQGHWSNFSEDGDRGRDRYSQLIFSTVTLLCVNGSLGTRFRWGPWKRPLFSTYLLYSPSIVCEWIPGYPLQMRSVEETAILNLSSILSLYCV